MKQPEQWIVEADAAWDQVAHLLATDLYSYEAFNGVLVHLNQRAADLGLAGDAALAARDVEHNLSPAIGLARLNADRNEDLAPAADFWKVRVRQAVVDMEAR